MKHVHVKTVVVEGGLIHAAVPTDASRPVYVDANRFFFMIGYAGMPKRARAVVPKSLLRYVGNFGAWYGGVDKNALALMTDRPNTLLCSRLFLSADVLRSLMGGAFGWRSYSADIPVIATRMLDKIVADMQP